MKKIKNEIRKLLVKKDKIIEDIEKAEDKLGYFKLQRAKVDAEIESILL